MCLLFVNYVSDTLYSDIHIVNTTKKSGFYVDPSTMVPKNCLRKCRGGIFVINVQANYIVFLKPVIVDYTMTKM